MKNRKRILSVTLKRMVDTSPDTSHLGEYANRPTSQFSIDRAHSEDCASLQPKTIDLDGEWSYWNGDAPEALDRAWSAIMNNLPTDRELQPHGNFYLPEEMAACDTFRELIESFECDCNGGDMGRNECRYFNPSFNYIDKNDKPSDGLTPEEVRKYTRQDYDRMERLNAGDWCYIGIRAEAETIPNVQTDANGAHWHGVVQRVSSGGLWGIESDSEKSYVAEVEQDELANLRAELTALGFSRRAISKAFQNVEHKDE